MSPEALVSTGPEWIEKEAAQPWGGCEWEIRQLVRYGLLDSVEDPEAQLRGGFGAGNAAQPATEAGSTTGMVAEQPGTSSEVRMTEAEHVTMDGVSNVIDDEPDFISLGGTNYAAAEVMDDAWAVVVKPEVTEF